VCGKGLPIHLRDWDTKRNEIDVFCSDHIPDTRVRVFTIQDDRNIPDGTKIGIRYLTDNAWEQADGNYPNTGGDDTFVDIGVTQHEQDILDASMKRRMEMIELLKRLR